MSPASCLLVPETPLPTHTLLQGMHVVGLLTDESDPAVSVMKVEHAPTESYADVGGLDQQIQVRALCY